MRCAYCLYKPDLDFHLVEKEIPKVTAKSLISDLREMGAIKLTIMGGEPTLYDRKALLEILRCAKRELQYEYVRLDTNGMFDSTLLYERDFRSLDEITFSLDSPRKEVNDSVRVGGDFKRVLGNMRIASNLGYSVQVTSAVHRHNVNEIEELVDFLEGIGVSRLNFHPILRTGVPRDAWTSEAHITPLEWMNVCEKMKAFSAERARKIMLRIPERIVRKEDFDSNPDYYGYCPERLGERILVHPNGTLRICALTIGTPYGIGWFDREGMTIAWNDKPTNELRDNQLATERPCPKQRRLYFGNYVPLCISFKPRQKEIVYEDLDWEKRRR
jgi:MoaA/NifB/PqqE/SkfB family radical SAM enzyme